MALAIPGAEPFAYIDPFAYERNAQLEVDLFAGYVPEAATLLRCRHVVAMRLPTQVECVQLLAVFRASDEPDEALPDVVTIVLLHRSGEEAARFTVTA